MAPFSLTLLAFPVSLKAGLEPSCELVKLTTGPWSYVMNEQNVSTQYAADGEDEAIYANPLAFGKLSGMIRTNPHAASAMLTLMSKMGGNGSVRVTQAAIAEACNSTLQQVEKGIADLADAGWIYSVDASTQPGGPLVCFVNPDLARAEKPDVQM
ncbi:hypothetical protein D3C71_985050 [compost metagenome]